MVLAIFASLLMPFAGLSAAEWGVSLSLFPVSGNLPSSRPGAMPSAAYWIESVSGSIWRFDASYGAPDYEESAALVASGDTLYPLKNGRIVALLLGREVKVNFRNQMTRLYVLLGPGWYRSSVGSDHRSVLTVGYRAGLLIDFATSSRWIWSAGFNYGGTAWRGTPHTDDRPALELALRWHSGVGRFADD